VWHSRRLLQIEADVSTSECDAGTDSKPTELQVLPKQRIYVAHAQKEAEEALKMASAKVAELASARTADDDELKKAIKAREVAKQILTAKHANAARQQKFQHKRRQQIQEMCEADETCRKKNCESMQQLDGRVRMSCNQDCWKPLWN